MASHPWRNYPDKVSDPRAESVAAAGEVMRLLEQRSNSRKCTVRIEIEGIGAINYSGTIASVRHLLLRLENRGAAAPELQTLERHG